MSKWISVNDRLPSYSDGIEVVVTDFTEYACASVCSGGWEPCGVLASSAHDYCELNFEPTHWMSLSE
jgi:hypothetical protein